MSTPEDQELLAGRVYFQEPRGRVWVAKDGRHLPTGLMEDTHLLNAVRLERRRFSAAFTRFWNTYSGEPRNNLFVTLPSKQGGVTMSFHVRDVVFYLHDQDRAFACLRRTAAFVEIMLQELMLRGFEERFVCRYAVDQSPTPLRIQSLVGQRTYGVGTRALLEIRGGNCLLYPLRPEAGDFVTSFEGDKLFYFTKQDQWLERAPDGMKGDSQNRTSQNTEERYEF